MSVVAHGPLVLLLCVCMCVCVCAVYLFPMYSILKNENDYQKK